MKNRLVIKWALTIVSKNSTLFVFVLSFMILLSPVWGAAQFYRVAMDQSKWRSSGSRLECRLSQVIPGYGKATFRQRALESMEFRVSSDYVPRKPGQALLFTRPTLWKRYVGRRIIGRVPVSPTRDMIIVPEDWAYRVALELREGMEAAWTHPDFADGEDIVIANVSPIHFESAWRDFQSCGKNLIDYGYSDVRFSIFYFRKKSMHLTLNERAKLDKLAEYVLLDTKYQYIKIHSHTDSRGVRGKNLAVSKKRARMMKKYLVDKGVDRKRFVIVARGEKKPKYNNRTRSGRAKNRRIEIRLIK